MPARLLAPKLAVVTWTLIFVSFRPSAQAWAQPASGSAKPACVVEPAQYHGWSAERVANQWVTLMIVPQLGGRLMQVTFGGHDYLFVNPRYYGQYFPPSEAVRQHRWFNYGGDKDWPLPEGHQDENHWPVGSDLLDDGVYKFSVVSPSDPCTVRLEGPADERTGLQYSRDISIDADSPRIRFLAVMKNISGHQIRWAIQSVTQYDTSDPSSGSKADGAASYNHDFWAFTPANPASVFQRKFDVHAGPVEHPSYSVRATNLFALHWSYLEGEVGLDSRAGWLAVVDGLSRYAMVERFHVEWSAEYPDRASVIFYLNGPAATVNQQGMPELTSAKVKVEDRPYYMEAELNSPLETLGPGESYALDTEWFPTRLAPELADVTDAGAIGKPLTATRGAAGIRLAGSFGAFWPGRLVAHWYDLAGTRLASSEVMKVAPLEPVSLEETIAAPPSSVRVSLHLVDSRGSDRGSLGEVFVTSPDDRG